MSLVGHHKAGSAAGYEHVVCMCIVCVKQDRDYEGLVETRLYLGVATPSSFRTYTVVAENDISVSTKLVQLLHSTYFSYP